MTRFDMKTFNAPAGGIYGGLAFMLYDQKDAVLDQFHRFISINADNKDDTETVSFIWAGDEGPMQIAMVALNTAGAANTTSFAPVDGLTKLMDDRRHRTYGEMIREYVSPGGPRYVAHSELPSMCVKTNIRSVPSGSLCASTTTSKSCTRPQPSSKPPSTISAPNSAQVPA